MELSTEPLERMWRKMAKEMDHRDPRRRTIDVDLDQYMGQGVDQAELIAAILAQREGHLVPVVGPDWASQFRPPTIPGTLQDKYVKAGLPARFIAYGVLWITWDWKRGAFVLIVALLLTAILITR